MGKFTLTTQVLSKLCAVNHFSIPDTELIFLGIRGALPINYDDSSFQNAIDLNTTEVNYTNPRCTLIQWKRATGQLAAFAGSTVPHRKFILHAMQVNGNGTNCLLTAYYKDFRKGIHKAASLTASEAFVQTQARGFRRTTDNLTYDTDDRVEFDNPGDNLHAAWCGGLNQDYSSAGCQVVIGYPKCKQRGEASINTGAWSIFHDNAYRIAQTSFPYVLLTGFEAMAVASKANQKLPSKLRFGSSGEMVKSLQQALKQKGFYEGNIDSDFNLRTLKALLGFQKQNFGNGGADGVCGVNTAAALTMPLSVV